MLYTLLCILILAVLVTGAYFAAQYVIRLQMEHKALQSDYAEAKSFIDEQAEIIANYQFERNELNKRLEYANKQDNNGWSQFDMNR